MKTDQGVFGHQVNSTRLKAHPLPCMEVGARSEIIKDPS